MKSSFRFSPKILARLGEELNQSLDQSVVELVKNAYDADANRCVVEIQSALSPGGSVTVVDDGVGMTEHQIIDGWLVLGKSGKETKELTKSGRVPAGSKGLGRLAALRMGRAVELETAPQSQPGKVHTIRVDWERFESSSTVERVPIDIVTNKRRAARGTKVVVSGLRDAVTPLQMRRLARSLVLLNNPFSQGPGDFRVDLRAPEFSEITEVVSRQYFDSADYHLRAVLNSRGQATVKILDWKGAILEGAELSRKSGERYRAPPATFDLWVFLLGKNAESFAQGQFTQGEIKAWLGAYGGVHVYEHGIRVSPYGNDGEDWLGLNLARARNPEERPSTNTAIGKIEVALSKRFPLIQKTDRSGYIDSDAFVELKEFATDALNWLAKWRLQRAEKRRVQERSTAAATVEKQRDRLESVISEVPARVQDKVRAALKSYDRTRERESDVLRKEVQLYRTLSTAGITAATFAHEAHGNPLKRIDMGVAALTSRVPKYVGDAHRSKLMAPIRDIADASKSLSVLGDATLSLVRSSKRRVGRLQINDAVKRIAKLYEPFLAGRSTELHMSLTSGAPAIRASEAAFESIVANMINNSLAAFERAGTRSRHIYVATTQQAGFISLVISDSGPGITDVELSDIWLPGVTSNPDGTGLGLTIVRDTVRDLGGSVEATTSPRHGGAEFSISIPAVEV
jgi:signal transduction histidine kinase